MNSLLLSRTALILELIAGFMLAPELVGADRIDKLHRTLITITSFVAAILSWTNQTIAEYRQLFSKLSYFVYFVLALAAWAFLAVREFQTYQLTVGVFAAYLILISFASMILEYFLLRKWTYAKIKGKVQNLNLKNRWRSQFLAELVEDSLMNSIMVVLIMVEFFLAVGAMPVIIFIILMVLVSFGVSSLTRYILGRLLEADFRYTLLKLGGILFVLKIVLQWMTL